MEKEILRKQYTEEISAWNWEALAREVESYQEENMEGEIEGRAFIGTVFSLFPSGKYYLPFACSNVDLCPICKGRGEIIGKKSYNLAELRKFKRALHFNLKALLKEYGTYHDFPTFYQLHIDYLREEVQKREYSVTCNYCEGLGSREALEDQYYQEALEAIAEKKGFFVTSGEGDPCDIFVGRIFDKEEISE